MGRRGQRTFEEIKKRKIAMRDYKHKDNALRFDYCLMHLIEEFGELIIAVRSGKKGNIAEELADLANTCEFTYKALIGEENGKKRSAHV